MKDNLQTNIVTGFVALFIVAAIIGILVGSQVSSNMGGYAIFDFLGVSSSSTPAVTISNQPILPTQTVPLATYQGVLNMLNKCKVGVTWDSNDTCDKECVSQNLGTCTESYYVDYVSHMTSRYECSWFLGPGTNKALTCVCCKKPGND